MMVVELARPMPDIFNAIFFSQIIAKFSSANFDKSERELTLSERIAKYGKLRIIFVCDENLGRSPMFASALRKRIEVEGLGEFIEVLSAGTDVNQKKSAKKYSGGAHPSVIQEMNHVPGIDIQNHSVTQYSSGLLTPNTILIVLNDLGKLSAKDRKKCFSLFDCQTADPYEQQGSETLSRKLLDLHEKAYYFTWELILRLKWSVRENSLARFPKTEKINLGDFILSL